jgi:hypothetical protein
LIAFQASTVTSLAVNHQLFARLASIRSHQN